jgi:DNA-binding transcriptional MerR regulator
MEYTVQKLARLAGISTRTLRYYDEIGLLKPARLNSAGYRIYGSAEADRLQQILFYRELGVGLDEVKRIINAPDFDRFAALKEHRQKLLEKRQQIEQLIANVEKTIASAEGGTKMTDKEKFAGFKQKMVADNEQKYGKEIRAKYGDKQVDEANQKVLGMTKEQYAEVQKLTADLMDSLKAAMAAGDPAGELAQKTADLHRQWLSYYWGSYDKTVHAGLARMYVADERFTAYYDQVQPGAAVFLRDAILIYTGQKP